MLERGPGSQKTAQAVAEAGGRQACRGGPGGQHHGALPLPELLHSGLLPLRHHLQVQRPVLSPVLSGSASSAFWKCIQARVAYLFVQLCKMLFLVAFFPTWEDSICDFIGEFMKASVDVADLIGLNLVMSRNAGKGEYKIMVAALGWATAKLIMSHGIPF